MAPFAALLRKPSDSRLQTRVSLPDNVRGGASSGRDPVISDTNNNMQSLAVVRRPLIPLSCRSVTSSSTYQLLSWLSDIPTATAIESGLLQFHDVCGSWSLEIFACTVAARLFVSLPSMTYTRKLFTTYALTTHPIRLQEMKFKKEMDQRVAAASMPPQMARDMRLQGLKLLRASMKDTIEKFNVHPGKGLVIIGFESLFWISYAVAIRNIVAAFPPSDRTTAAQTDMSSQGLLWFQDLTIPDPYCILPVSASLILLSSVQVRILSAFP